MHRTRLTNPGQLRLFLQPFFVNDLEAGSGTLDSILRAKEETLGIPHHIYKEKEYEQ